MVIDIKPFRAFLGLEVLGGILNKPPTKTIRLKFMGLVSAFRKAIELVTYKFLLISVYLYLGIFG